MIPSPRSRRRPRRGGRLRARSLGGRALPWIGVVALSAIIAILFTFRVSLSPPALHPREVVFAAAETQVMVDATPSQLTYYGQNPFQEKEYEVYTPKQAALLLGYLQTQGPLQAMAAAAEIPGKVVSASGPFTLQQTASNIAPTGPQVGNPPGTDGNYRLLVDISGEVQPMITLYGQAPTERAAAAIVNSARQQVMSYVARQEQSTHLSGMERTVVRPMGGTTGGIVDPGANLKLLGLVFGLVFLLAGGAVVAFRRRSTIRGRLARLRGSYLDMPVDDNRDIWPHTRRFLPWCLAVFMGMLFLVPIDAVLSSGNNSSGGVPISPTLDRVLLVAFFLGWVVALKSRRRIPGRLTRVHVMIFLFAGLCFLGMALNGMDLAVNQEVMPTVKKLVLLMTFITFFVLAADVIRPGEVRPLLKLLVGLGVVCAIGTIIERQTRWNIFYSIWEGILPVTRPPEMDVLDDIGRLGVVGPTSEPLELATLLSLVLPFSTIFALESKTRRERLLYLAATMIVMAGAIATARKTSIVAPVVGLLVLIAYRPRVMLRALLAAALPLFIAVHFMAPGQIGSVISELEPSHATAVNTDKVRVQRYDAVRPDIMSHLLLGRGFQSYDPIKYRYLDDEYLGLLIGTGVLGTVAFLAIFGSMLSLGHPLIRGPDAGRSGLALALQAGIVMIMVASALFDTLSFYHVSYLLFYLGALLLALRKPSRPLDEIPQRQRQRQRVRPRRQALPAHPVRPRCESADPLPLA